ncbi:uncharacterized protein LAESUDRAFT_75277 [Laetiporus sulphureus 93-53]|uniref:Uncharacterized protein n=1 Tax=Laetiporus sulphureus 93-53 TaxID=1314785 RepID=A0A165F0D6_9APHY|nr:uncharacterized protein LAESUDRAFT_75277 [Laetiporus sulphureus 93-53]KZT08096.1 hypothetical protein LAESUDRAFT_75277 [Laetiporus sulphureus 93-53]
MTTIRLISHDTDHAPSPPQLAPSMTTFDSALGSSRSHTPPASKIQVWRASPTQGERLYPSIPYEDIQSLQSFVVPKPAEVKGRNGGVSADKGLDMPGSLTFPADKPSPTDQSQPQAVTTTSTALAGTSNVLSPALKPNTSPSKKETLGIPRSRPFIFGSPLSKHSPSNTDFGKAAASVLEEMKKRLAEQKAQKGASEQKPFTERVARSRAVVEQGQQAGSTDRFAKVHEQTFSKMAPITSHYAARRVMLPESKKRDLATLGAGSAPGVQRKNDSVASALAMHGSGANGDEDAGDRRLSKRMRTTDATDVHEGKSISLEPDAVTADTRQKQRERDAIRRKVDTRRRSSWDKTSPGRKAIMGEFIWSSRFMNLIHSG